MTDMVKDTRQFETISLIQIAGAIGAAFLLDHSSAMWVIITGAWFVMVVSMCNTWRLKEERWAHLASWAEAATMILLILAAKEGGNVWALIGIRFGGMLLTFAGIGKRISQ